MQGVVRREYWTYSQGPQRGSGVHGELPKGAPHGTRGRVAPLANGTDHCLRGPALPQAPWDALKRQNTHDTTLAFFIIAGKRRQYQSFPGCPVRQLPGAM